MYKVLIADDEEIIRKGLSKLVEQDPDIDAVYEAADGEIALAMAQQYRPDLILVDINMPFLNGLDLIARLGDLVRNTVILVVTGYDDFSYAQQALRMGVFDYLLKPIQNDVFQNAMLRAKQQLSQSRTQEKYLEWAHEQLEKNRSALVAGFLGDLLEGRCSDTEAQEQAEYLGLSIPDPYGITIAHLTFDESRRVLGREWDENLMYYAGENIAGDLFQPMSPFITYKNKSGDLVVISSCEPPQAWSDMGRTLMTALETHMPLQAEVIQVQDSGLSLLPQAYDSALEQLRQRLSCSTVISETMRYIEESYFNPELSLIACASRQHLSPQHLSRLFRHETGITFVEYITRIRIRRAMELLIGTDLRMYEIAERVGYASQHYFSSAFKKVLGVSPAEYRRSKQRQG